MCACDTLGRVCVSWLAVNCGRVTVYMCACVCVCMQVCVCACDTLGLVCVSWLVCVCVCVCMCVCVCASVVRYCIPCSPLDGEKILQFNQSHPTIQCFFIQANIVNELFPLVNKLN